MMPSAYLIHITLDTGHARRSPREEIADDAVRHGLDIALRIAAGQTVHLPISGYTISGAAAGRCLVATVFGPPLDGAAPPVVTIGVGGHARCAVRLWRQMHALARLTATRPTDPPRAPWVAVRMEAGVLHDTGALTWLGDFERVLAWGWIERGPAND